MNRRVKSYDDIPLPFYPPDDFDGEGSVEEAEFRHQFRIDMIKLQIQKDLLEMTWWQRFKYHIGIDVYTDKPVEFY